jgi:hypothetical protein
VALQVYQLINLGILAFVTATTILVVTQVDEVAAKRRGLLQNLKRFIHLHGLKERGEPHENVLLKDGHLIEDMHRHLNLHFENREVRRRRNNVDA